ncbi:Spo11/DNA topoisomerase VI subunit A [Apiosordaria backusii]|uniref:DNA topoisomerase (ATP-hydrolyzing) n=1 Tax=Apiosordaria backusii TaxID=314023 RepID=A0AA40EHR6_9PEZI|nr:Spo11/DNA topoisomerase VI subunit A [Apiosordaria backusii]
MNRISSNPNAPNHEGAVLDSQESFGVSSVNYSTINSVSVSGNGALARIESLLEAIVDAIIAGNEISIPYKRVRVSRPGPAPAPGVSGQSQTQRSGRQTGVVRFPGRTIQEVKKFEALFCIIEISHEALLSGSLITKRNIYYQNPDLFGSQAAVDIMVDNLAFTLGLGRGDLNIVAAAKGLVSGPIVLVNRDGSVVDCGLSHDTGIILPSISEIRSIGFHAAQWILVIEKEATFRTLAAAQYAKSSSAGHGILITAKGFPDLATRRFLSVLHSMRPDLVIFGLTDFDPDGIAIIRTYQSGSKRLEHEHEAVVPSLRWLGVRSSDLLSSGENPGSDDEGDQGSQVARSHAAFDLREASASAHERPAKKPRLSESHDPTETVSSLTLRDRKKAADILRAIWSVSQPSEDGLEHAHELQRMLMLNIKAEIQAVDSYGDLSAWLDDKLFAGMH